MPKHFTVTRLAYWALIIQIVFSGYTHYTFTIHNLELDIVARAVTQILILITVFIPVIYSRISIAGSSVLFLLFTCYISIVSFFRNDIEAIGGVTRMLIYYLAFVSGPILLRSSKSRESLAKLLFIFLIGIILIDIVFSRSIFINSIWRSLGNIGSPIGYACFSSVLALLAWCYSKSLTKLLIAETIIFYAMLSTGTRSVTFLCVFLLAILYIFSRVELQRKLIRGSIGVLLFIVVSLIFLFYTDAGQRLYDTVVVMQGGDPSTKFRFFILNNVINNFSAADYLFGLGINGFPIWFYQITGYKDIAPHTELLWLLVEPGFIGTILYLGFIITSSYALKSNLRNNVINRKEWLLGLALLGSQQVLFQFANPLYFFQVMVIVYIVLGSLVFSRKNTQEKCGNE